MSVYTLEPVARYLNAYRSQESQKYSRVPSNIKLETVTEKPVLTAESPVMQKAQKTVQEKNNFFLNPTSDWEQKRKMYQDELKKDFQKSLQDQNQKKTRKGRIIEQQESYIPSTNDMRTFKINESFTKSEGYRPRQELLQKYQSSPSYYTEIEPSWLSSKANTFTEPNIPEASYYSPQRPSKVTFADNKAQLPITEEYFPFGRPGGGAPVRDANGNILAARPKNFQHNDYKTYSPQLYKSQDPQETRERQKEEWRKELQDQLLEKQRKQQEDKQRKMLEEKIEEAKVNREMVELEKKYKKEIRYERGEETTSELSESVPSEAYRPVVIEKEIERRVIYEPDKEREDNRPQRTGFYEFKPRELEVWQTRSEMVGQQAALREIISKLKQEASNFQEEKYDAINELERLKAELRQKHIDNEQRSTKYINLSYQPSYYKPRVTEPRSPFSLAASKNIATSSQFIPYSKNIMHSKTPPPIRPKLFSPKSDYSDIESPEAKKQLANLDYLLKYHLSDPIIYDHRDLDIKEEADAEDIKTEIVTAEVGLENI